ncbi:MAG: helix-turn-helix domain-containing protein [Coriobacteriales bacterium]
MDAKEIVRAILKRQMRSQRSLALQLGIPPQTLNNRLHSSRDLTVSDYAAILDALGYELKVAPKPDDRPEFTVGERGSERWPRN